MLREAALPYPVNMYLRKWPRRLTFELSGGEAVRLNEGLGVTGGGQARYGLNATDPAAARHGAAKGAPTFAERQRPQTD